MESTKRIAKSEDDVAMKTFKRQKVESERFSRLRIEYMETYKVINDTSIPPFLQSVSKARLQHVSIELHGLIKFLAPASKLDDVAPHTHYSIKRTAVIPMLNSAHQSQTLLLVMKLNHPHKILIYDSYGLFIDCSYFNFRDRDTDESMRNILFGFLIIFLRNVSLFLLLTLPT